MLAGVGGIGPVSRESINRIGIGSYATGVGLWRMVVRVKLSSTVTNGSH